MYIKQIRTTLRQVYRTLIILQGGGKCGNVSKEQGQTQEKISKLVYLQHNAKCLCHHFNGPERIHDIFELVLPENPVWSEPGTWGSKKKKEKKKKRCLVSQLQMSDKVIHDGLRWLIHTWVVGWTCGAWPGRKSFR